MSEATITALAQRELRDLSIPFQSQAAGDGTTIRFTLPVTNVASLTVSVDGDAQTEDVDYTLDAPNGIITFDAPPDSGTEIVVDGYHRESFGIEDWVSFVETAFIQHTHGRNPEVVMENPIGSQVLLPTIEEYLVAILASIQALWVLATRASMDIDVRHPDGVMIPRSQRFSQIMTLIEARERQYNKLAQELNVGLSRIQMYTLRRTSRLTNRLVPIYQPMEYDQINRGFNPTEGPVGTFVVIKGRRFTGATQVTFNGVPATFTVVSDTEIAATVPVGATSGVLSVTTPGGTVRTAHSFQVRSPVPEISAGGPLRVRPQIDPQL